jgi:amidase
MTSGDLAFASALEQAKLIRDGEVSSSELVELYLSRIEELNPKLGAYITVAADHARADAKTNKDGPFAGVPISIKDLADTAGIVTTHGTRTWADRVPTEDDEVVARLKRAGFVILGKTVTPEFGPMNISEPPGYPPGRNPWDPSRSCGGSSGGAAAAVAAGLCPVSHASDGGGSIRNPASWCGVFGVKTSRGRISWAPRSPLAGSRLFAVNGPITRTVADAAAMIDVMSGPADGDMFWAPPPSRPFLETVTMPPRKLRVGFHTHAADPNITVAPSNADAAAAMAKLLEELGHDVSEIDPPAYDQDLVPPMALIFAGGYAAQESKLPPLDTIDPWNRTMIEMGRGISAADYVAAQEHVSDVARRVLAMYADIDVYVSPTVAAQPPRVGEFSGIEMADVMKLWALTPFTGLWNLTGQPAANIPWSLDPQGMPVGVQVVAPVNGEDLLLRLCAQIEQARPWAYMRPPVA